MKKLLRIAFFAASTLLSGAALAAPCAGFPDVDASSQFCANVEWVKGRGITNGCPGGLYCPNDPVTRLQMAIFMNRLGNALATTKLFTDMNPGFVNIQGGAFGFVCPSTQYTPDYEQSATLHGTAWGLVNAPVTWSADLWYSTNGGATFAFISNYIPTFNATVTGMTSGSTFAQLDLTPGTPYIFAILIRESVDVTTGTGNFTDLACHLMVEIGNRKANAPLPPPPPPTCDVSPDAESPTLGCGDPRIAARQLPGGFLSGNRQP